MKITDLITRAGRSLKNAKVRTALTALAIGVGAFTLTATLAAGNGIRAYTDRLIANNFDPAESIVGRDPEIENSGAPNTAPKEYSDAISNVTFGGDGSSIQVKQITNQDIAALKAYDFVERVRPNYQVNPRYVTRQGQKRYTLSVQSYNPGQKPQLEAGSLPKNGDLAASEALLPADYIGLLGFKDARQAIGKEITISAQKPLGVSSLQDIVSGLQAAPDTADVKRESRAFVYTVSGVTKKGPAALAVAGLPVLLSDGATREMYDYTTRGTPQYGKYLYAYVRVKNGADPAAAAAAKAALKKDGYYVQTSQDIQKTVTQFVDILQALVGVFGVITVIASVFGVINTMYISVLERTREIGLMKALGAHGRDIAWLFRIEAAWIGFLGGTLGALAAYALGTSMNPWLTQKLGLGAGNSILIFDALQILALIAVLMLVAILAGWLPARKAARLDPIEALRTE